MRAIATVVLALLAASCSPEPPPAAPPPPPPAPETPVPAPAAPPSESARAEAAAKALAGTLMAELSRAMKDGGPENAVRVCGEVATRVAAEVSAREGIRVARTSLRTRNPSNAPDPWERRVLEDWEAAGKAEVRGETVGSAYRWMKPITVAAMCLPCHGGGAEVSPAVAAVLRERYPGDAATGYRAGDLRGAFTVTVPRDR